MTIAKRKTKLKRTTARSSSSAVRRANNTASARSEPDLTTHANVLDGLSNPFSEFASGARYPDAGAGRTLTTSQRLSLSISSDVNGRAAFVLSVKPNFCYLNGSTIVGNIVTWAATFGASGDLSTDLINLYGSQYRPTSFGAKYTNTLSATNSSGSWIVAKAGSVAVGGSTTFNPVNFSSFDVHPNAHGEEGHWHITSRPRTAGSYNMAAVSGLGTNIASDDSWETIYVYGSGLPASTTVGVLDIYNNMEYTTKEDAPIAMLAVKQPTLDIGMQTAVNAVQSAVRGSHRGSTDKVKDAIKREGKKALLKHVLPFLAKKAVLALA